MPAACVVCLSVSGPYSLSTKQSARTVGRSHPGDGRWVRLGPGKVRAAPPFFPSHSPTYYHSTSIVHHKGKVRGCARTPAEACKDNPPCGGSGKQLYFVSEMRGRQRPRAIRQRQASPCPLPHARRHAPPRARLARISDPYPACTAAHSCDRHGEQEASVKLASYSSFASAVGHLCC